MKMFGAVIIFHLKVWDEKSVHIPKQWDLKKNNFLIAV